MNNKRRPASDAGRQPAIGLLLLAGFLALLPAGRAEGQVLVNAGPFLAGCANPIAVTQNTRVTGTATVANSCAISIDPGVTLEFSTVSIKAPDLSIVDVDASVRVVNSRIETLIGSLGIDLGGASSVVTMNSVLTAAGDLGIFAGSVNIAGSRLSGEAVDVEAFGSAAIANSVVQSTICCVFVVGGTQTTVAGSTLTAATFLGVFADTGPVAITNSRLQAMADDLAISADTQVTVTGSIVTAAGFVDILTFLGTASLINSRVESTNEDVSVFANGDATVTASVLTAGQFIDVEASSTASVSNSRLQAIGDGIFVGGEGGTTMASSVLAAAFHTDVGALTGPTRVQTSRFSGESLDIFSVSGTTTATLNSFSGVTGLVTISGGGGCTSSKNVPVTPCL